MGAIQGPGYGPVGPQYGDANNPQNWVWDPARGEYVPIADWNAAHNPQPAGGTTPDNPAFPGGGGYGGSGVNEQGPSGYEQWNGGSPPAVPLAAGHGWEWDGRRWNQKEGGGIGYVPPAGPTPPRSGGSGGGSYQGGGPSGGFDWQPGDAPGFDAPRWQAPPEFVYNKQFAKPDAASIQQDPSFQFRLDQGRKALEQSAAGKGVLRTGGTLKDLVNYGQNFATNEYSNIYNRNFNEYKFDYDKEADIYARNYNLKRDVFDRNYKAAYDEYSPKLKGWEVNTNIKARQQEALFNREWQKYLADRDYEQKDITLKPY
jgi:hypothetical protein